MKVSVQAYRKLVANIVKPAVEFDKAEWDKDQATQSVKYQMVKKVQQEKEYQGQRTGSYEVFEGPVRH